MAIYTRAQLHSQRHKSYMATTLPILISSSLEPTLIKDYSDDEVTVIDSSDNNVVILIEYEVDLADVTSLDHLAFLDGNNNNESDVVCMDE